MLTKDREHAIEQIVSALQHEIWEKRDELLPRTPSYYDVLDPYYAAKHLGYKYQTIPELGKFGNGYEHFEVAGLIDLPKKVIAISLSDSFSHQQQLFTAAHEIGHAVLHKNKIILHRDRPIDGTKPKNHRLPMEEEADLFAACYRMPRPFIGRVFKDVFGCGITEFEFSENNAWKLCANDFESLIRPDPGLHSRALALAMYRGGPTNQSIAQNFNVSITAMAYRLEQLGLRSEWP